MDASWRPVQGSNPPDGVDPNAPAPATVGGDWRAQIQPEARSRIVNSIMETLQRHLPVSQPEGMNELRKIAVRFEEKIYTAATSQSDYLRKLSLKMLSMDTGTQQARGNVQVIPNQNNPGQEMDNVESTDASGSNTQGASGSGSKAKAVVHWTAPMSTMMLGFLADIVASGKRTSSGFKQCHRNQCAQVMNDHFKLALNHDQISNHLKKWRKIWGRLIQLKNLSGALWDEDTCTIGLSDEHYAGHCAHNKSDIPYLNTPIEHYRAMETIFGSTTATRKYAKSGNDPLSIDVEEESEVNTSPNVGESAGNAPPKKKAKLVHIKDDPLVTTHKDGFKMMAEALAKAGGDDDDIPDGLWDALKELNGFDDDHIAHYYAHLVDSPKIAKAFMTLSKANKLVWVGRYMQKVFGVVYNLH